MVRLQEPQLRRRTISVPLPPRIGIAMATPSAPPQVLRITSAIRLPLIATDMAIRREQASQAQIISVIPELTTMTLMVTLQVLLIATLTISELPEQPIRIREVIPGDHRHHQQIILEQQTPNTTVTTPMMISGRGKIKYNLAYNSLGFFPGLLLYNMRL